MKRKGSFLKLENVVDPVTGLAPCINDVIPTEVLRLVIGFAAPSTRALYALSAVCTLWHRLVHEHSKWMDPEFTDEHGFDVCSGYHRGRPDVRPSVGRPSLATCPLDLHPKLDKALKIVKKAKVCKLLVCVRCTRVPCSKCKINNVRPRDPVFNNSRCCHRMCASCHREHVLTGSAQDAFACPECFVCMGCGFAYARANTAKVLDCYSDFLGDHKVCKSCFDRCGQRCGDCAEDLCSTQCYDYHVSAFCSVCMQTMCETGMCRCHVCKHSVCDDCWDVHCSECSECNRDLCSFTARRCPCRDSFCSVDCLRVHQQSNILPLCQCRDCLEAKHAPLELMSEHVMDQQQSWRCMGLGKLRFQSK